MPSAKTNLVVQVVYRRKTWVHCGAFSFNGYSEMCHWEKYHGANSIPPLRRWEVSEIPTVNHFVLWPSRRFIDARGVTTQTCFG